eukprot:3563855-Pyramimonas_sp.AAC.1
MQRQAPPDSGGQLASPDEARIHDRKKLHHHAEGDPAPDLGVGTTHDRQRNIPEPLLEHNRGREEHRGIARRAVVRVLGAQILGVRVRQGPLPLL